jgi:pimeloyl-ACP methyl ester carboxylesterase
VNPWLGLALLLLAALCVLWLWGGFLIAWDAMHPPRKGFAWALGTGRPGSPEALGVHFKETTLPGLDGTPCPAWRMKGGDDGGPILLMLHGWGRSRWDSLARVSPLLPLVREAWLPDLPAHGEHAGRRSWVGVREPEAVAAMAAEIAARNPGARIVLMGHSLGAGVAIRAAARAGSLPIAGVIALAPYRDLRSPIPGRMRMQDVPSQPFTALGIAMLRAAGCMDEPLERDAAALHLPLLVIACEADRISPAADAETIAAAAPDASLLVIAGDRHDEPGAGDPERFAATLRAFVGSISRPSPASARADG